MHGPKKKLIVILKYHMDTIYWCKIKNESICGVCMENLIAKLDADTMAIILAVAYGLASDLIGQMPIKPNSVPALIWAFIRGGVETVLKIKGVSKLR